MNAYYKDDHVTIYNADCREIIGDIGVFDMLVTDPPYGMEFQSGHRKRKHKKIYGDAVFDIDLIMRLMKLSRAASYIFCRWDNLLYMPKPKSCLAWVKNNWSMGDLKHEHGRQWEACCFYPGEYHKFTKRIPDVITAKKTGNVNHPTEKPVSVLTKIIECNVCESILDPFAGSGSTGRAAKDLGKKATLIEIDESYCEISANRMLQESLFF